MATIAPYTDRELRIKALIYGEPGSGKTTLAASAAKHPEMSPVLILSAEGGMLSVEMSDKVSVVEVRNWDNDTPVMDRIDSLFWQLADGKLELPPYGKYKTIIIDSATEVLTLSLESNIAKRKGNLDDLWLQDYGKSTAQLKRIFRYFRDLPMNVIVTALAQDIFEGKGESAIRVGIEPAFTNKLRASMKGVFDHVWALSTRETQGGETDYFMLTRSKGLNFAKTRGSNFAPALGQVVKNPAMPNLYELLKSTEGPKK